MRGSLNLSFKALCTSVMHTWTEERIQKQTASSNKDAIRTVKTEYVPLSVSVSQLAWTKNRKA